MGDKYHIIDRDIGGTFSCNTVISAWSLYFLDTEHPSFDSNIEIYRNGKRITPEELKEEYLKTIH